ncbi:Uu.00g076710.m01.CDS01 [Anthostomella pinea]|uniref:Uu.00g076710.m01.CDS01 n=1 Tax=Anthostomella pinea TaxID=933095 RepID=A0AAI8VVX7_9PEZI|nr:Uu.00g076710.m01.CDS01 [Anthostomella pinea]
MRTIPNRYLPLIGRYGTVLLAALLVYYIIRDPVTAALSGASRRSSSSVGVGQGKGTNTDKWGKPILSGDDGVDPKDPILGPAAAAQGIRDQNAQIPVGDDPVPHVKTFKPEPPRYPEIKDHFPWLTHSHKSPPVPENNLSPVPHVEEQTPLFIGFTRNWPLLLQCVSSYVAAGWPASDIYVVENTGTFRANRQHELSLQNPFFLNHTALHLLGVNVLATPTLLTFAQLQNYFLHTALQRNWPTFFWSHQDVLVISDEDVWKKDRDHDWDHDPYATIYERCVGLMRYLSGPDMPPWGTHFFAYDQLTLVNRDAYLDVGAWDTHIPYQSADCDMYLRLHWAGYWQPQSEAGLIFDVGTALDNIGALFRFPSAHATFEGDLVFATKPPGDKEDQAATHLRLQREAERQREEEMYPWVEKEGESFNHLVEVANRMQEIKLTDADPKSAGRSIKKRQERQTGGLGEPFYRHPEGFAAGVDMLDDAGRRVFADKWGHRGCDLLDMGIEAGDAWRLERDWDIRQSTGAEGGNWGKDWMVMEEDEYGP